MKKTRKALSLVLSFIIAFASMPMMYTATVASEISAYAIDEEGTIENPTIAVTQAGEFSQNDSSVYHLNINQEPTEFVYYQTKDNQYFELAQSLHIEKYCGTWDDVTVMINKYGFDMSDSKTNEFFNVYNGEYTWYANDEESAKITAFPNNQFEITGNIVSCPDYKWNMNAVFTGRSSGSYGELVTGYKQVMSYTTNGVAYETVVPTTLRVLDARKLVEKMAESQSIVDNAEDYTKAYVSAHQAALNSVPDDLKDFSVVYTQAEIDSYVDMFNNLNKNSADYTEYNKIFNSLKVITNEKGAFTNESYKEFVEKINSIDAKLSKELDKSQQATVDAATQALKNAYADILVSTDLSETNESYYWDSLGHAEFGNVDVSVDNRSFKFMQIKDDQKFSFTQAWIIDRASAESGDTAPTFYGIVLDPNTVSSSACTGNCATKGSLGATNGTNSFIHRVTDDSKSAINFSTEEGTTISTYEFTKWTEPGSTDSDIIDEATGKIACNTSRQFTINSNSTYTLNVSPTFIGMSAQETGGIKLDFVQRFGIRFKTGTVLGLGGTTRSKHMHIATDISITDVRSLIDTVASAKKELSETSHTESYKTALQAAIDAVPMEMLYGVKYYTQAEVDELEYNLQNVKENAADYSEFNELYNKMIALENDDRYTDESYQAFREAIEKINFNLDKTLDASQQAIVDAATEALREEYVKLDYYDVDEDTTFSEADVPELDSTYNTLSFDISKTEYNFMQTLDGQELAIRTDVHFTNTDSGYKTSLHDLEYSVVTAGQTTCTGRENPDDGCHCLDTIADKHNSANFVGNIISGIEAYGADSEEVTEIGVIAQNNGWVVDEHRSAGTGFISDGKIVDAYEIGTGDYYASSEIVCKGFTGGFAIDETAKNLKSFNGGYSWRFGWQYRQNIWGSTITNRHVHIPVDVNVTDARALTKLYYTVEHIINNHSEYSYTMGSLSALYYVWSKIPVDMVEGTTYYTQDVVNDSYATLYDEYTELEVGANYNEYFDASVKVQEIVSSGNRDEYGNPLYTPEAFEEFVKNVTEIDGSLDKNMPADEAGENQRTIDAATEGLLNEMLELEKEKRADYTAFEEALAAAEKLEKAAGGEYTDSTKEALDNAIEAANQLDKNLSANDQEVVDAVTEQLVAATNNLKYKADYSDFNNVYNQVEDIVNNPDEYTSTTVEAAKKALEDADKLDKDLPDSTANRQMISDAAQSLRDILEGAEKKADYAEYNNAKSEADSFVNDDGNGNTIYDENAFNDYKQAVENIDTALSKDLPVSKQEDVNNAVAELENLKIALESNKKADYTDFNAAKDALEEIVNAPAGTYTDETVQKAQDALEEANKIPSDMVVGENNANQDIIDAATDAMQDVIDSAEKKADYTEFDKVVDALEDIVNAPDGTYTDEAVKNAQDALDNIVAGTDKDLPETEQDTLDEITSNLQDVIDSAEKKADYTEFDKVVDALEDIVNAPDGTYTDEAVKNAQDALDNIVAGTDKDLPETEQDTLDEITSSLQDVVDSAKEKADYTDYNNAKAEADSLVNDDGNGTPIYNEDAFDAYKEAVENIDIALDKDLPATEQETVDAATQALEELKANLDKKKIYTVTFVGVNGETLSTESYVNGSAFGTITAPAFPEATDVEAYVGWLSAEGTLMTTETVLTGDVVLTIANEFKKLVTNDDSTVSINDETGYVTGIDKNTTVAQLKAELQNDETVVEIKHYTGAELADESLVGTGSTITLKSKYTDVIYETRTIIIYGDLDGDGDVDADDCAIANETCVKNIVFTEEQEYFFVANDVCADGYLDALDSWLIGCISRDQRTVISVE